MPQFTFEGPDGQRHTIEGPQGATKEEAFKMLNQHLGGQAPPETPGLLKSAGSGLIQGAGAPGDLSNRVLGNPPAQQPVDQSTYYGKLVDALNMARKSLELPTTPQVGNAVGMQPTEPVTTGEKVVQRGASMLPGAMLGGNPAGRAMMGAGPAANAVRGMAMSPQGPASSIAQGGAANPGDALQNQLLRSGLEHGVGAIGHALGGPLIGTAAKAAARFVPKVLGLDK